MNPNAPPSPKRIELDAQQLTIFRYLYVAYVAALKLEPGPVECVPTASLPALQPHYFEPLSEADWQRAGYELLAPTPSRFDADDLPFCHAYSVISVVEHCLEETPSEGQLGLNFESD
jgi:hypothetical protein